MKIIGLIPSRRGSKRLPGKNMALLGGKPLLRWAIEGAKKSGIFDAIAVTTDWPACVELAENMGVNALCVGDPIHTDACHDFMWVEHALCCFPGFDLFVILRPTSPFRTGETIRRAVDQFLDAPPADSMRAVERTPAHPLKSWKMLDGLMIPYKPREVDGFPAFDMPTQRLGDVYVQNGCIHVAWTKTMERFGNVSGQKIKPFLTEGREGIDINNPEDLRYAEWIMGRKA